MALFKSPKVAVVSGHWGQNIGNAFFNLGGMYVMEEVFGRGQVAFFQDQPNYRTLHNKFKGNPKSYVDFIQHLDLDYIILQGPVLNSWMRLSWEKTFEVLKRRGVRVILHSCAFFKFTDDEIKLVKAFLDEFPPFLIATRDSQTFKIIKDWIPDVPKYDGIDAGFFVNKAVKPFKTRDDFSYIVSNFDRYPEPEFTTIEKKSLLVKSLTILKNKKKFFAHVPRFLDYTAHKSKIWSYVGNLFDRRKLPERFENLTIVRPEHRFFPHVTHKIYRQANSFTSDEPWTYLNVYANSELTLSDRVHACVATLAYGGQAMLYTPSPRKALFGRVGLENITKEVVKLNQDYLDKEQNEQIKWLKTYV